MLQYIPVSKIGKKKEPPYILSPNRQIPKYPFDKKIVSFLMHVKKINLEDRFHRDTIPNF